MESNLGRVITPTKVEIVEKDFGLMESARNGSTNDLIFANEL